MVRLAMVQSPGLVLHGFSVARVLNKRNRRKQTAASGRIGPQANSHAPFQASALLFITGPVSFAVRVTACPRAAVQPCSRSVLPESRHRLPDRVTTTTIHSLSAYRLKLPSKESK